MADFALALTMAIWGSSFSLLRFLLSGSGGEPTAAVSPMALLAARMGLAALLLVLFMLAKGALARLRRGRASDVESREPESSAPVGSSALPLPRRLDLPLLLRDGIFCGVLLGGGFLLQTEGLLRTTASRSGFFTGLLVLFVPLLELTLLRRKPAPPALVALGLAFVGMALLSGPLASSAGLQSTLLGDLLTVGCALVFAAHIIALGRVANRHPLLPLLLCQIALVGLMAALLGPLVETVRLPLEPKLGGAILYLALLPTLVAFAVQTWAMRLVTPLRIAIFSALEPVFAAAFAAVLLGERLAPRELAGGALIIVGVLVGEVGAALRARSAATQG